MRKNTFIKIIGAGIILDCLCGIYLAGKFRKLEEENYELGCVVERAMEEIDNLKGRLQNKL